MKFTLLQNLSSWLWAMEPASLLSVSVADVPPGSITGLRMTQFLFPRLSSSETLDSKMPYHNLFFLPFSVLPNSLFFYKLNIKGSGTEQNKLFFRLLPLQQTFKMYLPLWAPCNLSLSFMYLRLPHRDRCYVISAPCHLTFRPKHVCSSFFTFFGLILFYCQGHFLGRLSSVSFLSPLQVFTSPPPPCTCHLSQTTD